MFLIKCKILYFIIFKFLDSELFFIYFKLNQNVKITMDLKF